MVEIKETSYKDERLGFFADQRKLVQKRYDRLEKAIKPDEPYMSERRQFLSDCGRELSFYNDIIEMLENDVAPKSELEDYKERYENTIREVEDWILTFNKAKQDVAREIFKKIKRELEDAIKNNYEVRRKHIEKHGEILDEFDNHTYGKILALDGMLGFIEHLEKEYGTVNEEEKGECACNKCFHNCTTFCDFTNHCKKKFMELDEETDIRLGLISE